LEQQGLGPDFRIFGRKVSSEQNLNQGVPEVLIMKVPRPSLAQLSEVQACNLPRENHRGFWQSGGTSPGSSRQSMIPSPVASIGPSHQCGTKTAVRKHTDQAS